MDSVPGTRGYEKAIGSFVDATGLLSFPEVCKDFLEYLPGSPARILDLGAGVGQNALALAQKGHKVVAIEPLEPFLAVARRKHAHQNVTWLQDSLPLLAQLDSTREPFDFILVEAVWHHLNERERKLALKRIGQLLKPAGRCALSLRNGPAGVGSRVFPVSTGDTVERAKAMGLTCVYRIENRPSILPDKEDVTWARIVLHKYCDR